MKRIIGIVVVSLLLFATAAQGVLTYDSDYYRKNLGYVATGVKNRDPVYLNMAEVETLLELIQYGSIGTGSVFYVDSGVSVPGNGTTITAAKATLDEAVNLCENDRGDLIFVLQGHTEAMGAGADEVDIDVDGVTIIQVGSNTISNGFDYTGTTTGAFAISGDNVTLINLRFHANVPNVLEAIDLEASATRVSFIGCLFDAETPGTDEFNRCIKQDGANVNQLTVRGCEFRMGAGSAECAIDLIDSDYAKIVGNFFEGDYSIADVNNATTASIHILIADNVIINGTVGGNAGLNTQPCIQLVSTTSGVITGNTLICNEATPDAAIVGADMWVLDNFYTETEGGVSVPPMWLTTDTALNILGFDDADNVYASTSVAANSDGTIIERLEQIDVDTSATVATAINYNSPNYLAVATGTFDTTGTWSTVAAHEIAVVTGHVRMQIMIEVLVGTETVSADGTIALGCAGNTAFILAATDVEGGAGALVTGDIVSAVFGGSITGLAGTEASAAATHAIFDVVIPGGLDVGYTVGTNALDAGSLIFHIWWTPLDATGAVTAGAGGPF